MPPTEDSEIDDILSDLRRDGKKKKRVNSSQKGNRGEREVCAILREHFEKPFAKVPQSFGSGAWGTTHEDIQAGLDLDHMSGDILTPHGFAFTIENKKGYDIEFLNLFPGSRRKKDWRLIDGFIVQAERDAKRVGKIPMVLYKKDRCPIIAFIPKCESHWVPDTFTKMFYKDYVAVALLELLQLPESFFFRS